MNDNTSTSNDIINETAANNRDTPTPEAAAIQQPQRGHKMLKLIMLVIWILATILTIAGSLYLLFVMGGRNGLIGCIVFLLAGGLPVVLGGGYVLFKVIPETDSD